jgi:D-sedoheptulose 7-phosphate isomerase
MSKRAVFLDRDGVINSYVYQPEFGTLDSPANPEEFALLPGVANAIATFKNLGFLVVVVSNQPGIAKGKFSPSLLDAVTDKMQQAVATRGGGIDAVYYCLHHPQAVLPEYRRTCDCRKPAPGLLLQAAEQWEIDLHRSYTVGDGIPDVLAGEAAGTTTIFISQQRCYVCDELSRRGADPDYIAEDLVKAAEIISNLEAGRQPDSRSLAHGTARGSQPRTYTDGYIKEAVEILHNIDASAIERAVSLLAQVRERHGRLFILGVGGGAGHASHAVCDFRKICGMEAYAPSDNVSELTARINDDGWETAYANWLKGSKLGASDMVMVFSVGGGDLERNVSINLVRALQYARQLGASICCVVGRDGGFAAQVADACILIRVSNPATVTPHTEAFQALVWHLMVSHPGLKSSEMKWESMELNLCSAQSGSGERA